MATKRKAPTIQTRSQLLSALHPDASKLITPDTLTIMGIRMPSLALEWMLGVDVFPFSFFVMLAGKEASAKSSLLFEICRWFYAHGGFSRLEEAESKLSPELASSIIGHECVHEAMSINPAKSIEEWQADLSQQHKKLDLLCAGTKEKPGPGKIFPVLYGVDSLVGKLSQASMDEMDKKGGQAQRGHPVEALLITRHLKYFANKIADWPAAVVIVNHATYTMDKYQHLIRSTKGGNFVNFQKTLDIDMSAAPFRKSKYEGVDITLKAVKNSIGPSQRQINVKMAWWHQDDEVLLENGETTIMSRQHTKFMWGEATIRFLKKLAQDNKALGRKLDQTVDLNIKSGKYNQEFVWSRELGIPEKEAVLPEDAGNILAERLDVVQELRNVLSISKGVLFEVGVDFDLQREQAASLTREKEIQRAADLLKSGRQAAQAEKAKKKVKKAVGKLTGAKKPDPEPKPSPAEDLEGPAEAR